MEPSHNQVVVQTQAEMKVCLYASPELALKAVTDDFLYWSGKLTDSSFQLSVAMIGANWAVFGSKILDNTWADLSVFAVLLSLGLNLLVTRLMTKLHRAQVGYAESDPARWRDEFARNTGKDSPYPFTKGIEDVGRVARELKTWLPMVSAFFFLLGVIKGT